MAGCPGELKRSAPTPADLVLTLKEFVSAVAGFGLPSEIDASPEVVRAMLLAHKVVGVKIAQDASGPRSILTELILDNDTTLHLAGGGSGPTVYKITRRRNESTGAELQADTKDGQVQQPDSAAAGKGDPDHV